MLAGMYIITKYSQRLPFRWSRVGITETDIWRPSASIEEQIH